MNGPEVFDGGVLDDAELALDAGIVHGNVETAESRDRFVDEVADVVLLLNVGPNELCLGAKRSQLRDKVLPLSSWRPDTTTLAPLPANATAVARPMPVRAPVMRTTCSSHLFPSAVAEYPQI